MAALLACLALAHPQGPRDLTRQFDVAAPVRVDLWAESPSLYNPTALDVDEHGRVWVAEAVNYRQWQGRNPGRHHEAGDRIVVLEDRDGDGAADSSTVFAQDPDLVAPLGVAVIGDRVYVSCSPHLLVYRDTDGDLRADEREILLTGFGGRDHDHGLHSVVVAPWGELIWCTGNAGPHLVTDRTGWDLRSGSLYNDGGPGFPGNRPGLVSDDGRIWTGGLVGTIRPDGSGMRVLAHNFRNNYEAAPDAFGAIFVSDNDDDGNGGCRTVAITEGGNYGFFSADGARFWQADRRPGQERLAAHWHQDDPGVMPLGCENGTGGPTGVAVYEAEMFPHWNGAVLDADAGRSLVYLHRPSPQGGALVLEHGVLIEPAKDAEGERGQWFRPSDVAVAPDGSILIADWWDPGVGGHAAGDGEAYGRILRLVPPGGPRGWGPLGLGIDSPAANVRGSAVLRLLAAGESPAPAAASGDALRDAQRLARRVWIWALQANPPTALREASQNADPRVRLAYGQAIRMRDPRSLDPAAMSAHDPSALVRAGALAMLRDRSWEECRQVLEPMARAFPRADRALLEAIGIGADGKEEELFAALLLGYGDAAASAAAAGQGGPLFDLAWRLHPPGALQLLRRAAESPGAQPALWRAALDAIAFMPEREAAEAMVAAALAGPAERRATAAWWVRQNAENLWRAHGVGGAVAGDFAKAEQVWQSEVIGPGRSSEVEINVTGADVLWLVVNDGGDAIHYDWADWIEPCFVGPDGAVRLTTLDWIEASAEWGEARKNAAADGRALRVRGAPVADGIGTHANSRIGFQIPAGAKRFLATCAADDSGAAQPNTQTSIRFAVYLERRPDRERQAGFETQALAGDATAALALLESVDGAVFLIERAAELNAPIREAIAPRLQNHPDLSVRALAGKAFPRKTAAGDALPPLDEIAALAGDAGRGRELFRGRGTCSVCHVYGGLGGPIGPELTMIRKKFGARELLDALLNPSAGIAFGFDSWTLTMKDGRVHVGSILADGDRVVLRDLAGQRQAIESAQIARRERQSISLMPEAPALGLNAQDLADLAAFLREDPEVEPRFGSEIALFDGASLDGWKWHLPAGADPAQTWSIRDGVLRCGGTPAGYVYTERRFVNFELTLEWRFDPAHAGNSGVLCRLQEPHQVWPRSLEAQLNSGDAGDIWNIGEFRALTAPERTEGRHTFKLLPSSERPLGEWNRYRIRLDHGRFTLEVNGTVQNVADWCEELSGPIALQSEGALIEYRNIRLREILD